MQVLSFFLFFISMLLFFNVKPDFKRPSLKQKVKEAKRVKRNFIQQMIFEVKIIFTLLGHKQFVFVFWGITAAVVLLGVMICSSIGNYYLIVPLSIMFAFIPYFFLKLFWGKREKEVNDKLEAALNAITTSYLRGNHTVLRAVEENLEYMAEPISGVFQRFLVKATMLDSNIPSALNSMKNEITHTVFWQWIYTLVQCERDHNLKVNLPRILDRFSEWRTIEAETNVLISEHRNTFVIMLAGSLVTPVLMAFLSPDWFDILIHAEGGKITVAVWATLNLLAILRANKANHQLKGVVNA